MGIYQVRQTPVSTTQWLAGNFTSATVTLTTVAQDVVPAVSTPTAPRYVSIANDTVTNGADVYVLIGGTGTVSSTNCTFTLGAGYIWNDQIWGDKISMISSVAANQTIRTAVSTGVKA